jgi:hypothetical protein
VHLACETSKMDGSAISRNMNSNGLPDSERLSSNEIHEAYHSTEIQVFNFLYSRQQQILLVKLQYWKARLLAEI